MKKPDRLSEFTANRLKAGQRALDLAEREYKKRGSALGNASQFRQTWAVVVPDLNCEPPI
jgi:hypothetical protein